MRTDQTRASIREGIVADQIGSNCDDGPAMASTADRSRGTSRPNLLYILSDQHCPFVTGCYRDPLVETPHLDALAAAGVTMDGAYCPSPICGPSRMAMLTGLHPFQNRSWTNRDILDSAIPTMAHALGASGCRPVLIGRLHSMGPDQRRGYAERLVGDHSPNYAGAGPVPDRGALNGTAGPDHVSLAMSGAGQSGYEVHDEEVTDAAVRLLQREGRPAARKPGSPAVLPDRRADAAPPALRGAGRQTTAATRNVSGCRRSRRSRGRGCPNICPGGASTPA